MLILCMCACVMRLSVTLISECQDLGALFQRREPDVLCPVFRPTTESSEINPTISEIESSLVSGDIA